MSDAPHKFAYHIGDYLRDTDHLSLLEHGVYNQLMLWYYSTAQPIPAERDRIYRRIRARTQTERKATERVLAEFFTLEDGKFFQKRIEFEISQWKSATASARESARQRWEKSNKNNGSTHATAQPPQSEPICERNASLLPLAFSLNNPPLPPPSGGARGKPRDKQNPLNGHGAWWTSEAATQAVARQLGMTARGGESWEDFRGRIRARLAAEKANAPE